MSTKNSNNFILQEKITAVNAEKECTTTSSNYIKLTEDEDEEATLSTFEGSLAFISS